MKTLSLGAFQEESASESAKSFRRNRRSSGHSMEMEPSLVLVSSSSSLVRRTTQRATTSSEPASSSSPSSARTAAARALALARARKAQARRGGGGGGGQPWPWGAPQSRFLVFCTFSILVGLLLNCDVSTAQVQDSALSTGSVNTGSDQISNILTKESYETADQWAARLNDARSPAQCTSSIGKVCSWINSEWLARRVYRKLRDMKTSEDFATFKQQWTDSVPQKTSSGAFMVDSGKRGEMTLSSYFYVKLCDVETASCLVSGSGYDSEPESSSDFSGQGTTWSEHVETYMPRIVVSTNAAGYIGDNAYKVLSEQIHSTATDAATLGGRWVRIPYITCDRIPGGGAQLETCRTDTQESKHGVLVRAMMYVTPVEPNPAFKWPPQGSPKGMYLMSGFLETTVNPREPCDSGYASLCALHNVKALLGKVKLALETADGLDLMLHIASEITFGNEYLLSETSANSFYVFFIHADGPMIAHGVLETRIGDTLAEIVKPGGPISGAELHSRLLEASRSPIGADYVSYLWPASGCQKGDDSSGVVECPPLKKVSYVSSFKRFGVDAYIGVGYNHVRLTPLPLDTLTEGEKEPCRAGFATPCADFAARLLIGYTSSAMLLDGVYTVADQITHPKNYPELGEEFFIAEGSEKFYIFMIDYNGTFIAHGASPGNVGKRLPDVINNHPVLSKALDGDELHNSFIAAADVGGAYVSYDWVNTTSGDTFLKIAYINKHHDDNTGLDLYIGCGYNTVPLPHSDDCPGGAESANYNTDCSRTVVLSELGETQVELNVAASRKAEIREAEFRKVVESVNVAGVIPNNDLPDTAGSYYVTILDAVTGRVRSSSLPASTDANGQVNKNAAGGRCLPWRCYSMDAHNYEDCEEGRCGFVGCASSNADVDLTVGLTMLEIAILENARVEDSLHNRMRSVAQSGGDWIDYSWARGKGSSEAVERRKALVSNQVCEKEYDVTTCVIIASHILDVKFVPEQSEYDAEETIKLGAVLSETGATSSKAIELLMGYSMFIQKINTQNNGRGIEVKDSANKLYYYRLELVHVDDESDPEKHKDQLKKLLKAESEGGYGVHFVLGSLEEYAESERDISAEKGFINMHCCMGLREFFIGGVPEGTTDRYHFGVQAPYSLYPVLVLQQLAFNSVDKIAVVYRDDSTVQNTICQAAMQEIKDLANNGAGLQIRTVLEANYTSSVFDEPIEGNPDHTLLKIARSVKEEGADALFACTDVADGKMLVNFLYDMQYPLRATYLSSGPDRQSYVDALGNRSSYLMTSSQWAPSTQAKDRDDVFGSGLDFQQDFKSTFTKENKEGLKNMGIDPDMLPEPVELTGNVASAAAAAYVLSRAIQHAFLTCDIMSSYEPSMLFREQVVCNNQPSYAVKQVSQIMASSVERTFFGNIEFDKIQQNQAKVPLVLQICPKGGCKERRNDDAVYEPKIIFPMAQTLERIKLPAVNPFADKVCPPGTHVGPNDFDACIPCKPGYSSSRSNSPQCDSCLKTEYENRTGSTQCYPCPEGTIAEFKGATDILQCECKVNYFNQKLESGVACEPCHKFGICPGNRTRPYPKTGFWGDVDDERRRFYSCSPSRVCEIENNVNYTCADGYASRTCAMCADKHYRVFDYCIECPEVWYMFVQIFSIGVVWIVINKVIADSFDSIDTFLAWAQLANVIGMLSLNWPTTLEQIFTGTKVLDFDVDIVEPTCGYENWDYENNLVVQCMLPVAIMGLYGIVYCFSWFLREVYRSSDYKSKNMSFPSLYRFLKRRWGVPTTDDELLEVFDSCISGWIGFTGITYLTVTRYCLNVFYCEDMGGAMVLSAQPGIECHGPKYRRMQAYAIFGIFFLGVGPLAYMVVTLIYLRRNKKFNDTRSLRLHGWMYARFKIKYWWYSVIGHLRRFIFVVIYVGNNKTPVVASALLMCIVLGLLVTVVYARPYLSAPLQIMHVFLLVALLLFNIAGILFLNLSEEMNEGSGLDVDIASYRSTLENVVYGYLIVFVMVVFVVVCMEALDNAGRSLAQRKHRKIVYDVAKRLRKAKLDSMTPEGVITRTNSKQNGTLAQSPSPRNQDAESVRALLDEDETLHYLDVKIQEELYNTFNLNFLWQWISRASEEELIEFDVLSEKFGPFLADNNDTSYLSLTEVALFWRTLCDAFPEILDYLIAASDESREHFLKFANEMFMTFYSGHSSSMPSMLWKVIVPQDRAALAQLLAVADSDDRQFIVSMLGTAFSHVYGEEEARYLIEGGERPRQTGTQTFWNNVKLYSARIMDTILPLGSEVLDVTYNKSAAYGLKVARNFTKTFLGNMASKKDMSATSDDSSLASVMDKRTSIRTHDIFDDANKNKGKKAKQFVGRGAKLVSLMTRQKHRSETRDLDVGTTSIPLKEPPRKEPLSPGRMRQMSQNLVSHPTPALSSESFRTYDERGGGMEAEPSEVSLDIRHEDSGNTNGTSSAEVISRTPSFLSPTGRQYIEGFLFRNGEELP